MIPSIDPAWEPDIWQQHMKAAFRDGPALLRALELPEHLADTSQAFATLVPQPFVARMRVGDADDPLLRQVLPVAAERAQTPDFVADPLAEVADFNPAPGLIHKYAGRALLMPTPACAVHCRYCFRRHFPYDQQRPKFQQAALEQIAGDTTLREIILSGGDPLMLSDGGLTKLLQRLNDISHVRRIRIHTRTPIILPQRVTAALLAALDASRCPIVVVVHCNHPQELNADTARALACLRRANVHLLNQSVLLKGINNDAAVQIELAEKLFSQGALPYYLHMPDRVQGTAHTYLDDNAAQPIYRAMQANLPGYLLPRLVREEPYRSSKTLLGHL